MLICKYCEEHESPNKSGLTRHEKHCLPNPNKVPQKPTTLGRRFSHSEATKQKLREKTTGRAKTQEKELERIAKIKEKAQRNNGGLREGSGRGKKGWYKGIYCRSSWELAFVIYNLDHDIEIRPCKEVRTYIFEDKERRYYPDFVVDNVIYEIKGYKTKQWEAKHLANPDIIALYKKELNPYIEYVIQKYGKDFIKMYETEDRVTG